MSNILQVLGRLNGAEKARCVKTMITVIMLERKLSEKGVGQLFDPTVGQATISRWANGNKVPDDRQFQQVVELFFGPWHYLCSFAEQYNPSLALSARKALFQSRANAPLTAQARLTLEPSIEIDVHLRPAKLVKGAWAHTFANHSHTPSVFIILVRDDLSYDEQKRIGCEEMLAHVIQPNTRLGSGLSVAVSLQQHFPDRQSTNSWSHLDRYRGQ